MTTKRLRGFKKRLKLTQTFGSRTTVWRRVYIHQQRYDQAVAQLKKAIEVSGGSNEPVTQLGYVLAKSGQREQAKAIIDKLRLAGTKNYVPAYSFAMIYNGLGESEEALRYLEKSLQEREVQITFIKN